MSRGPAVSVIIPTYNQASLLRDALASLVCQTATNWEAFVIDNNSSDQTISVVEEFGDSRIHLLRICNDGVIAKSRNLGISKARGEWVAFLDSDDLWEPGKLEICLAAADSETDLVSHREQTITGNSVLRISPLRFVHSLTHGDLLFWDNFLSPTATMVRLSRLRAVGGFSEDPALATAEDYDLWLRLAERGIRVKFLDDVLSSYRLHGANSTRDIERHMEASLAVVGRHFSALKDRNILNGLRYRCRRAMIIYAAGRSFDRMGRRARAIRYLLKSLVLNPIRPKTIAALILAMFTPAPEQANPASSDTKTCV